MATLSVIRRWALREQLSIREISRRTGLSRNTIRKYLCADSVEPSYAKRVSPSKLDPFATKLAGWRVGVVWEYALKRSMAEIAKTVSAWLRGSEDLLSVG